MVRVGEQTGEMATTLEKAAERFDRQLSKVIERATALIQPVIMLAMAAMVGGMAWMMINIVFSTLQQVNQTLTPFHDPDPPASFIMKTPSPPLRYATPPSPSWR